MHSIKTNFSPDLMMKYVGLNCKSNNKKNGRQLLHALVSINDSTNKNHIQMSVLFVLFGRNTSEIKSFPDIFCVHSFFLLNKIIVIARLI